MTFNNINKMTPDQFKGKSEFLDFTDIVASATKQAESRPGYKIHPNHAKTISYGIQFFANDAWHWFTDEFISSVTFGECVKLIGELEPDNPGFEYRIVAIVEVKR